MQVSRKRRMAYIRRQMLEMLVLSTALLCDWIPLFQFIRAGGKQAADNP
jgi:hypothetical protein